MLKNLAFMILLVALAALVGVYIVSWLVAWQLGAMFTGLILFSASVNWATDYLDKND